MMWDDLLAEKEAVTLPWTGGRTLYGQKRRWKIVGALPPEYGWCSFEIDGGRTATYTGPAEEPFGWEESHKKKIVGYLVGDRMIPDHARIDPDPDKVFDQTIPVHFVDPGLDRFTRAMVVYYEKTFYVFARMEFPIGPENEVLDAYLERQESVAHIKEVIPAMDLAFRFESQLRFRTEERRQLVEARREERLAEQERQRQRQELVRQIGTGEGRRQLARVDFPSAARAALQIGGAELLDTRQAYQRGEQVVQFRLGNQRFECQVEQNTLNVLDSGICLNNHDKLFTLESLPGVITQAVRERRLHITRRIGGDYDELAGDDGDEDDW